MIVQQKDVKGGIAAVTNGYYDSKIETDYDIRYVESYCDTSKFKMVMKALGAYREFGRVLRDFKPELIHIHSSFGGSFYRMQPFIYMAGKRGIPILDHCHGADFETFYVRASDKKKARIGEVFGKFSKVIVLSEEWKERLQAFLPDDKLVVINNYCKPRPKEEVQSLLGTRFEKQQILFLGELGQRKGGYDFAGIVENVDKRYPGARFVFAGSGSKEDEDRIKKALSEKGLMEKCLFPGWVRGEQKDKLLMESSLFMLPSYQEGLPMAILDAMAYGLPVVSTEVGGIPQLIENGKSGFLAKPGDCKAIADGICRILDKRDDYGAMSNESYRIARDEFGFDAHLSKLEAVYEEILND
ncbi:glycosyltransferase family 4 protein [Butyrivibrio sp. VCB2006]|uniref:glycosyltransferase family 4 protein n=1 Tax=Butyrivibrio sp. VCB2006 TaxID=1280679 RepID=UPI00040DBD8D|nr:glycosyltransferase family 4 protein [Butyrivibrio sp. VCB2006]